MLVSFLLVAAIAVVYWQVHTYPFVLLDDHGYVVENPHVRPGMTWDGIAYAFTSITVGNWHPVTMLSHMLDCQLFGVEQGAGWHHAVNVVLHAANTVLLFFVLGRMTGAFWQSALAAAAWIAPAARRIGRMGLGTQGRPLDDVLHAHALGL